MNAENTSSDSDTMTEAVWPRKLNKVLIGIGVLAFGLIIVDRLVTMFQVDDLPDVVNIDSAAETSSTALVSSDEVPAQEAVTAANQTPDGDTQEALVAGSPDIAEVFGSPLVFVSTAKPAYVITEDERRISVGSELAADTTLAGVTSDQVIIEKAGELMTITLPDPGVP